MVVDVLQHINLRPADLERTKNFYVDVMGLEVGPRPPIPSVGYWIYLGATAVIHLVERPSDWTGGEGGGVIDHVAFHGVDFDATKVRFRGLGVPFRQEIIPRDGTRQLFVHDPDGVQIELNFDPA